MKEFNPWDVGAVKVERAADGTVSVIGLSEDQFWALLSGLGRSADDSDSQDRADDLALMDKMDQKRREIGA